MNFYTEEMAVEMPDGNSRKSPLAMIPHRQHLVGAIGVF